MRRPLAVAALLLPAVLAWACAPPQPRQLAPPNVLVLLVDCLRFDHLSAHGYERPTTPNLDTLVQGGVDFTRAYAPASWTRPSVPSILTGLYPSEHGLGAFVEDGSGKVSSPALAGEVVTLGEALQAAGYATAVVGEQFQLSPRFGLQQGYDFYKYRGDKAQTIHRLFFDWLGERRPERFFAYLHYLEIHWPYCPPASVQGTFDAGRSQIRWCHKWRELRDAIGSGEVVLGEDDLQALKARYDEELLGLDQQIGRLFAQLRKRGLWDETLIVLMADHGEEFFEHGKTGHGQSLYEELLRVPYVFKPPASWGLQVPAASPVLVELRTLTPTVIDLAGGTIPAAVSAPSLRPWLLDPQRSPGPQPYAVSESGTLTALVSDGWKMIVDRSRGDVELADIELYDLGADPGETRNLASTHRDELARLRGYLRQWQDGLHPAAAAATEELDAETKEGLEALGYIE